MRALLHFLFLTSSVRRRSSHITAWCSSSSDADVAYTNGFLTFYYLILALTRLSQMIALWPESQHLSTH